ncbi:MAG: hypothetical protein QM791_18080 [Ferruginibacter sp.]
MKRAFLFALAGALTLSIFAADSNKGKSKKNSKAKTEKCCSKPCDKTKCTPKQ